MGDQRSKSVLLRTSSAADVRVNGGVVNITGLPGFRRSDILAIKQLKYKAEVSQVVTAGAGSYTPAGDTVYGIKLVSAGYGKQGNALNTEKIYKYKTPVIITDIGSTAALQREAIHVALVALINADSSNFVAAATLGTGTGFTITDDAGYFPARANGASNGREGATNVYAIKNTDGTGWTSSSVSVTTAAVYGFGVGARMYSDTPVIHSYTGNLISGELDAPVTTSNTYAVSGQQYEAFVVQTLVKHSIPTVGNGVEGYRVAEYAVFVDNGAGTDTTNAAGFLTFEREMQRLLFGVFERDPQSIVEFFDNGITVSSYAVASGGLPTASGVPSGAVGDVNVMWTGKNALHWSIIGTATAIVPQIIATGLSLDLDATDNDGLEITPSLATNCPKQFVIGTDEFSLFARITITDVSDLEFFHVGFRKKEAYQSADGGYATYTDLAALGFDTETATQAIKIITNLNDAVSPTSTDTGATWADAATKELEVRVLKSGDVKFFINRTEYTSTQASAFVFDSGDTVVPYIYHQLGTSSAPTCVINRLAVVSDANWRL